MHRFTLAICLTLLGLSLMAPAPALAANCGANNQRPCKLWEGVPSCNSGLYEDFGKGLCLRKAVPGRDCGRAGQRPCLVVERIPSCNKGLVEDFLKNRCVRDLDAERRALAIALAEGSAAHQRTMGQILGCMSDPQRRSGFDRAVQGKDLESAERIASACVSPQAKASLRAAPRGLARATSRAAAEKFFNSLSIGVGMGVMIGVGTAGDLGIVIDLNGTVPARFYTSGEWSHGLGVSVGADLIVGVSRDRVAPAISDNISVVAAGKFLGGAGLAVIFDNNGDPQNNGAFNGFSASGGVGVGAQIGTTHKSNSRIW